MQERRCKPTETPQEKELERSEAGTEMPNGSRNRFGEEPNKVTVPFSIFTCKHQSLQ